MSDLTKRKINLVVSLIAVSFLGNACSTVGPTQDEVTDTARESLPAVTDYWSSLAAEVGEVKVGWIESFNDKLLADLVQEAQENNKDLQLAAINIDRSWALAEQAGAALKPSVGLRTGGQRKGTSVGNEGGFDIGVQASWELDLWGRVRSGRQAAVASAEAAEADYRFAQHSLAAAVSSAYFLTIEAQSQEQVAIDTVDALSEINRIVAVQKENGLASGQDVSLAQADLATANDILAAAQGAKRNASRSLELLLGRYPSADLNAGSAFPKAPAQPSAGLPSEILERRPDLIAAERRVAAAMNTLDSAQAAKLPQISLTASTGGSSNELSGLLDPSNMGWSAATNLLAPIFDGGALNAQVEISTADQQQAVAAYARAALNAFSEVEAALDLGQVLDTREKALNIAFKESEEALRLARLNYKEGEIGLLDVLSIQQRVFSAQSTLLSIQRNQLDQYVNLNLALGGDWRNSP